VGPERSLASVCGAPAVLLRMDLSWQRAFIDWIHGEGEMPAEAADCCRIVYRNFSRRSEELAAARVIREHMNGELTRQVDAVGKHIAEEGPFASGLFGFVRYMLQAGFMQQKAQTA
jgi:hypothetical protein